MITYSACIQSPWENSRPDPKTPTTIRPPQPKLDLELLYIKKKIHLLPDLHWVPVTCNLRRAKAVRYNQERLSNTPIPVAPVTCPIQSSSFHRYGHFGTDHGYIKLHAVSSSGASYQEKKQWCLMGSPYQLYIKTVSQNFQNRCLFETSCMPASKKSIFYTFSHHPSTWHVNNFKSKLILLVKLGVIYTIAKKII